MFLEGSYFDTETQKFEVLLAPLLVDRYEIQLGNYSMQCFHCLVNMNRLDTIHTM